MAAAIVTMSAGAQEVPRPDTSAWKCEQCPFARGYVADYELGGAYVSEDAAHFGNGTGYDEQGGYVLAAGSGDFAADAYRMRWELADLGLDSRAVDIRGGQPGIYMYRLGYEESPYRRFDTTVTVFRRAGADTLVLPAGWVPAGTTDGFVALDASLADHNIGSDRQSFEAGGRFRGIEHLQLRANYRRTDRDGRGIAGASFYNNAVLLPTPFDDSTDTVDFAATYSRDRWFAQLSWSGSYYDNSNRELRWESPYGNGQGAVAQAPDNDAQTLTLAGAYHFAAQTVLSLSASIGEIRQDEPLLPYTINPVLTPDSLPRDSFDGQIDTTHVDLRLTSRPWSFLRLKGLYAYDDRDNGSAVALWSRTITDLFPSNEPEANRPYSFRRSRLGLSAQARLDRYGWLRAFEFEGGYDRDEMDRDLQEVAEQTEETGWGRVRWRPGAGAEVTLRAGASRREPERYDPDVATALEQNPLLRKYTLAYRFRDFAQLRATLGWPGQGVSVGGEIFYASDDYTRSLLGLRKSDDRRFGIDLTWSISARTAVYLQGSYQDIESRSVNSESFDGDGWNSQQRDRFRTLGAGFDFGSRADPFNARVSLVQAKGLGDIDIVPALVGAGAYPQLQTDLKSATVDLGYRLGAAIDLRLRLRYEDFAMSDWALQGVEPATIPTVLSLGADTYDDEVYLVSLSVRYSFGRPAVSSATPPSE